MSSLLLVPHFLYKLIPPSTLSIIRLNIVDYLTIYSKHILIFYLINRIHNHHSSNMIIQRKSIGRQ
ncbi:hypothetical protein AHAS_Ahas15G0324300 [Arachis hypogaea]